MNDLRTTSVELARLFANVSRGLHLKPSLEETLQEIARSAVMVVDGCEHAGVVLLGKRRNVETTAATSALATEVECVQHSTRQGPLLSEPDGESLVCSGDLSTDPRWPDFGRQASRLGVRSMLSFRLAVDRNKQGALNLYSSRPEAFGAVSREVGGVLATHAVVALSRAQRAANLLTAIRTRQLIGEACGILMERHRITSREAFQRLSKTSQDLNLKLRDVAEQVALTGVDPAQAAPAAAPQEAEAPAPSVPETGSPA